MTPGLAVIFGIGLAASTATQLRVAGPFGPGEGLLLLWLGLAVYHAVLYPGVFAGPAWLSERVSRIWILLLGSLAAGIFVGQWAGLSSEGGGVRDLAALSFVALLSIAFASVDSSSAIWRRLVTVYLAVVTLSLLGLLLLALVRVALVVDPWFQAIRFRGWSLVEVAAVSAFHFIHLTFSR